jgi:hypothetical protein
MREEEKKPERNRTDHNDIWQIFTCNAHTPSSCTRIVATHLCCPSDHNRTVPSELPDKHWNGEKTRHFNKHFGSDTIYWKYIHTAAGHSNLSSAELGAECRDNAAKSMILSNFLKKHRQIPN